MPGESLVARGRHAICGLRGHRDMLHFGPWRLFLICGRCGRESAGWVIEHKRLLKFTPRTQRGNSATRIC